MDRLWIGETILDNTELIYSDLSDQSKKACEEIDGRLSIQYCSKVWCWIVKRDAKKLEFMGHEDKIFVESIKGFL